MKYFLIIIFLSLLFLSCTSDAIKDPELHNLVTFLTGEFSNKNQVENDASFAFQKLTNTRIWKNKPDYWMFSKIAGAKRNSPIYFQRVIRYKRLDSVTFKSTSYKIKNLKEHQNAAIDLSFVKKLKTNDLASVLGCELYFKKETSSIYSGKTKKGSCTTTIPNVDYISSSVVVSKGQISSWTKGFNTNEEHIWGKIKGPYKYIRVSNIEK